METLLEKTRRLNKILQSYTSRAVSFMELSEILSEILNANIYIASKKGKVLGYALAKGYECDIIEKEIINKKRLPEKYNEEILQYTETNENIKQMTKCVFDNITNCENPNKVSTIIPVNIGGTRYGTLLLAKFDKDFTEDDLVLGEYSATIVGMEIIRSENDQIEKEAREKAGVQMAIGTLSYSELEAMEHIFNELDGDEGLLVASKVADRVGITRSVIVNALRKLESAGVIESRSLGMKGTHIKILNDKLIDELEKIGG